MRGGQTKEGKLPVYTYDYLINRQKSIKIIIVDDNWEYKIQYEFNQMMQKLGLCIGEDYIYHSMISTKINTNRIYALLDYSYEHFQILVKKIIGERKLVVIFGNCQTLVLIDMLSSNQEFQRRYVTCEMPEMWKTERINDYRMMLDSGILSAAEYLFTQSVSPGNRFGYIYSTEYILSQISDSCTVVTISNLYFKGYYPQLGQYNYEKTAIDIWERDGCRMFDFYHMPDIEALELIIRGMSDEEIIEEISKENYYSLHMLQSAAEVELEEFRRRESETDIKMADFLAENYDKFLMFATVNHPTKDVLLEFARRILKKLEIDDMDIVCEESEIQKPCPQSLYQVIYPSVLRAFGFHEMQYQLLANLHGQELPILSGINKELDIFIEENRNKNNEYKLNIQALNFKEYMLVYLRVLRLAIAV